MHSGDATLLLPAQKLWVETIRRVKRVASAICKALNISGPFNIQLMAKEQDIKVYGKNNKNCKLASIIIFSVFFFLSSPC